MVFPLKFQVSSLSPQVPGALWMSRYAKYCPSDTINQQPADTDYKFVYLAENTNISTIYTFQLRINLKYAKKKTRLIH